MDSTDTVKATEAELRRRAMESMRKKSRSGEEREAKDSQGSRDMEDGEVDEVKPEDGEADRASKKQKVDHDAAGESNGTVRAGQEDEPPAKKTVPRWQMQDEDEEEEEKQKNSAVSGQQPPAAKQKSKWADSPEEEEGAAGNGDAQPSGKKGGGDADKDLVNRAAGTGDAASALDLLEAKLGKKRGAGETGDGVEEEAGKEGEKEEAVGEGGDAEAEEKEEGGDDENSKSGLGGLHRCRDVDKAYQKLNKIDEGTYGVVYRAKCRVTQRIVALKQVKLERAREGFPLTALRELTVLLGLRHVNIVEVIEVVVSPKKQVFMVMEYMEHDFRALMESMKAPFRTGQVKCLMRQLLSGIDFMHRKWVIHRDLKTSNLLLDNRGNLKVCDFGLARTYRDPIQPMTPEVVTLWYRAPELLYGDKNYSIAIDLWSVGCIFAEFLLKEPLLRGKTEQAQRDKISELLGSPDEDNWPGFKKLPLAKQVKYKKKSSQLRDKLPKVSYTGGPSLSDIGYDLLSSLLAYSPDARPSAEDALQHHYFAEAPLACKPEDMPTWPSAHETPRGMKKKSPTESFQAENFFDEDSRFNRAAA